MISHIFFATILASVIFVNTLLYAHWFYKRQNQYHSIGGPISTPKALWLGYAIHNWFFTPFVFILAPDVMPDLRFILWVHLFSWWLRGPIELYMIYKSLNWSPIYGIGHDLAHIALIGALLAKFYADWGPQGFSVSMNTLVLCYFAVTIFALIMEALFAYLFRKTRGFESGANLIYFASDNPIYRRINRLTLATVIVVYAHSLLQLIAIYTIAISKSGS